MRERSRSNRTTYAVLLLRCECDRTTQLNYAVLLLRCELTALGINKVKFSILELEWVYLVVGVIAAIVAAAENHVDILAEEGHTEARLEQTKLPVDHSLGHVGVAAGEGVADKFSERIYSAHSGAPDAR